MKKRLVAFLLVLIMVLGMLPVSAFAADDGVSPQALESNETQTIKYQILYVGDEFNTGYNYGVSVNKTYTCQYSTGHSGFNHSILISEFRNVGVPALKGQLDSGYEFVGWAKEAKKNPTIFDFNTAGTTATQTTYTIYLVAKKAVPPTVTYTLTYYPNTTDLVTNMPSPNPVTQKSSTSPVTFTVSSAIPAREGYNFLGWNGKPDATTPTVQPGNWVTTPATATRLYAVWQSNTPPTDKPAKPTENDVTGVVVDIVCVTTTGTHDTVQYPLGHPTDAQHTIGEVVSDGAGGYICPVTVRTAWFVQQASNLVWKVQHTPTAQTITFNLTYDKTNKKWVKPAANPRIEATHEVTPPRKPALNEGSPVCVQCEKTNSIHVQNGKDYARMYFGVSDSTRYTEVLKDGKNVWKDDNGVWTYQIKLKKDKYIEAFNTTPLINSEHTDLYPDQDAYVTWKRDGNQWKIVPVSPNQSGIGAVINVTCKLKAPTADELKKLDMAVQVKCVVDAAQQHTSAYGLLGEYDKDYFVGEPKKVGDDWLCDISYDPDPYVAAFNKAFPTPKHIQNDEKIVPVTLIWVGGSWQIKTQGRVLVTEVYTVTFDSYGGTPVPPAQEVEYGLTATKPADPTLKGYTFAFWYLGEDEQNATKITEIPTGSTGDRVITAYWNWPVHLHYLDKDNNEIESATLYVSELEPGACVLPTGEKTGYDFDGWYEAKKDIGTASHKLNALSIAKKWELYGRYTAKTDVSYTVKYLREGDNKVLAPEKVVTDQTFDTEVTEQAADVVGYTPDAPSKTMILDEYNKVLTFSYSANTYDYTVRHIKQLPDGSYDEANAEVETLSGKFEALAAVTAKDYGEHYPTNDADTKQNIKIEKGLTIDVKYDLDEHTLTFETNGGSAINPVTVRHGNAVARPADPTKDKYTFIGWYADPEFTEEYDFATVLEADKTIYAKFELTSTPIGDIYVRYDVLHIKQLPDGTYDLANAEVEHLSAKKDTTVTAVAKNYSATHHFFNSKLGTLTGTAIQPYMGVDGKPVYTILSVYYDLDFRTLTFDTMGGSKIAPETVRHGLTVAKPKDPVNGGFLFDGWYTDKTYRTPYNFATPLTQDTTIYAKWFLIVLPGVTVKKNTPKLNTADHFAYVQGYPDGTVKPAGNITRAETAAILFRLMDDASRKTYYSTKSGFRDVASGSWYNTYVATLNNAGVITDSSNGYFRPNEAITRAELAAMLAKFSETTSAANYFNDVSAKYWAANAIAICAKLGWITGYPDGTFRPDKNVTRAELMAMINRATGRAPKSADAFLPGMKTWIDNTSDKWYYLDVQEATNSHSYTVKGSETWTALTSDPNWSLYE